MRKYSGRKKSFPFIVLLLFSSFILLFYGCSGSSGNFSSGNLNTNTGTSISGNNPTPFVNGTPQAVLDEFKKMRATSRIPVASPPIHLPAGKIARVQSWSAEAGTTSRFGMTDPEWLILTEDTNHSAELQEMWIFGPYTEDIDLVFWFESGGHPDYSFIRLNESVPGSDYMIECEDWNDYDYNDYRARITIRDKALFIKDAKAEPEVFSPKDDETTDITAKIEPYPSTFTPTGLTWSVGIYSLNGVGPYRQFTVGSGTTVEIQDWNGEDDFGYRLENGDYLFKVKAWCSDPDVDPATVWGMVSLTSGIARVKSIKFSQSLTLYDEFNSNIEPTWQKDVAFKGVAYKMPAKKAQMTVTFRMDPPPAGTTYFEVKFESEDQLLTSKESKVLTFTHDSPEQAAQFDFALPQSIKIIKKLIWYGKMSDEFNYKKIDVLYLSKDSKYGAVYVTLDEPKGAMKKTLRIEPLYIACSLLTAENLDDENIARKQLVPKMWDYLKGNGFSYTGDFHWDQDTFFLANYLKDQKGDCRDVAALYHLVCSSVSIDENIIAAQPKKKGVQFNTQKVLAFNDPSHPYYFNYPNIDFHMLGEDKNKMLYDSLFKYEQILDPKFVMGQLDGPLYIPYLTLDLQPKDFKWVNISIKTVK